MSTRSRLTRRFAVITIYAFAIAFGVDQAIAIEGSSTERILSCYFAVAGILWVWADARIMGLNLVWPARIGILVFGPIGLIVYIVWSRGRRGVRIAIVAALIWWVIEAVAYVITSISLRP